MADPKERQMTDQTKPLPKHQPAGEENETITPKVSLPLLRACEAATPVASVALLELRERQMKVGDRVCHTDGNVGYVETVDECPEFPNADVRWLTPKNVPSCVVSLCHQRDLTTVSDKVIPQPRSKAWWRESREFCAVIAGAIRAATKEVK